ncbi:MAG: hypothetical protein IJY90_02910 [Clostridia bacterium]|nr:hypothetical protein [Clostridia bacterium]
MFNKIWEKLKNPKGVWLAIFYVFSLALIGGTIALVVLVPQHTIGHFALYILSALALTYFAYTIVVLAPKIKQGTINVLNKNKFTAKLLISYGYRTIAFGIASFCFNLAYVVTVGVFSLLSNSYWYFAMSMYYLVLSVLKGIVFYYKWKKDDADGQRKTYKFCGIIFMLLVVAFSGLLVLLYKTDAQLEYAGLLIYVVATYTFAKVALAVYNLIKAKKQDDLYVQSIRNINLASAMVSVVMLQVALVQAFSPTHNTTFAHALTGAAAAAGILAIGIIMLVKSNKINKQKEEKNGK